MDWFDWSRVELGILAILILLIVGNKKLDEIKALLERANRTPLEKYADGEDEIVGVGELINEVALVRNQYLGITKGFEIKHFQLSNIIKLRVAGMEDSEINTY